MVTSWPGQWSLSVIVIVTWRDWVLTSWSAPSRLPWCGRPHGAGPGQGRTPPPGVVVTTNKKQDHRLFLAFLVLIRLCLLVCEISDFKVST